MILRKINAIVSLITTVLLLAHAIFHALWMFFKISCSMNTNSIPWILFIAMMLHAIISIVLAFLGHKGAEKRKCNGYANMNTSAYIQRASGVSLIILTVLHVAGTIGILHPPKLVHAILPPLFFTIVMMHTAISTSRAFITLGIGNFKFVRILDSVIKSICIVTLIADVTGFYLFLV